MARVLVNLLEYLGYRIYDGISCILPECLSILVADIVGVVVCIIKFRDTAARKMVMEKAAGVSSGGYRLVIKGTQYFNRDLVFFFRSGRLNPGNLDLYVHIEGLEYLDRALACGRGVVLASSHLGCWEMTGVGLAVKGYPAYGMVWPSRNKILGEFLRKKRLGKGVGTVSSHSLRRVFELLRENNAIGIMTDVDSAMKGVPYRLWGYDVALPRGACAIAEKSGAELLIVVTVRRKEGGYNMFIEKPHLAEDEEGNVIKIFEIIKRYIEENPVQWHWLRSFFPSPCPTRYRPAEAGRYRVGHGYIL